MLKLLVAVVFYLLCFVTGAQVIGYEEFYKQCCHDMADKQLNENFNALNIPSVSPAVILFKPIKLEMRPSAFNCKMFCENLIYLKDSNLNLKIDPAFDFRVGVDDGKKLYKNTRGFILNGQIGKNLFVRSEF